MSAWMYDANATEIAREKLRRGRLFQDVIRRKHLVSFESLADWYARENADRRQWALKDLGNAVSRGEFGPPERASVFYLPVADPPTYKPFWIRRTGGQINHMRASNHDETPQLWAPRGLCAEWLAARQIHLPPWLSARQVFPVQPQRSEGELPPLPAPVLEVAQPAQPALPAGCAVDDPEPEPSLGEPPVAGANLIRAPNLIRAWKDWIEQRAKTTRREAEKWATDNNFSVTEVRKLHRELGNKPGRPRISNNEPKQ